MKHLLPVLFLTAVAAQAAQPGNIMSGLATFTTSEGFYKVSYATRVEPTPKDSRKLGLGGGVSTKGKIIHRFVTDTVNRVLLGYDLTVEPAEGAKQYRVSFAPLTLDAEDLRSFKADMLTPMPFTKSSSPQFVTNGQVIAIDLFVNPSSGEKVVDYIQISGSEDTRTFLDGEGNRFHTDTPRDFRLEDVEFRVMNPELFRNGTSIQKSGGGVTGAVAWLQLPDRGRFVFSISPREGYDFRKAGRVRGNLLTFEWNGDSYEWRASQPILTGGPWNLYVMHDDPPGRSEFTFGTCDRVEYLLSNRVSQ